MKFVLEYWQLILGCALLIFAYVFLVLIPQLRENDVKNVYQHSGEPRLLLQTSELEKTFWTKYERERMRYMDAKNRWATVQTPVIPFPMNTAWEFQWFGKNYHISTVGLSYSEYLLAGVRFYHQMRTIWDRETCNAFGTKAMMEEVKGQKPVDVDKLWQNTQN